MSRTELAGALLEKADQDEYIQIRDGVYLQSAGDLEAAAQDMPTSTLRDHPYWIICAPNHPIPIDTRDRLEELIELYGVKEEEIYF